MKYIGYFNVESNSIYITDPCYDPPTKNSKNNCELAIPNGVWFAYTKESCYTKNAELLTEKADKCGLATNNIGVPLLWDGKTCYSGADDVINFLINAANL